jgi:hypothetical protein
MSSLRLARPSERLRRYVERVEKLLDLSFFKSSPGETLKIMGSDDGVVTSGTDGFDEEALMATIGLFRMLFHESDHTGFVAAMNLLLSHVRSDSPLRAQALRDLRGLKRGRAGILRRADIAMVVQRVQPDGSFVEERMSTKRLVDLWLNGYFLHGDETKAAALEEWPIQHLPLWEFCGVIRRFGQLFAVSRNVVMRVLESPALAV